MSRSATRTWDREATRLSLLETARGCVAALSHKINDHEASMAEQPIRVLFVCLGNICRSPLAECLFQATVRDAGLGHRFEIDSAGTSSYHEGEPPDSRAVAVANRRGLELTGRARQIRAGDLERFDYILVMDAANLAAVERLARSASPAGAVHLLGEFDPESGDDLDVPDPYFGGAEGFERVHNMVERACRGLLEHIRQERAL